MALKVLKVHPMQSQSYLTIQLSRSVLHHVRGMEWGKQRLEEQIPSLKSHAMPQTCSLFLLVMVAAFQV